MSNDCNEDVAAGLKSKAYNLEAAPFTEAKSPSKVIGYLSRVRLREQPKSHNSKLNRVVTA
jgi:hypothetical protein